MSRIPVIELERFRRGSPIDRRSVARKVDRACREIGFVSIAAHGVSSATLCAARDTALEFFALPQSRKAEVARPARGVPRGWLGVGHESLARSRGGRALADLNESFQIGPLSAPDNLWPSRPAAFQRAWSTYYRAMEGLALDLTRLFAVALGLPAGFFDRTHHDHASRLRSRHYPPQPEPPPRGQLRAGAHTDYVSFAILNADPFAPGLQARDAAGRWHDVSHQPEELLVNIGDLLRRWTNDRWMSPLHRVVNPPPGAEPRGRLSLVFFHCPGPSTRIECLESCCRERPAKYRSVTAGEWVRAKLRRAELA
jgi:isopenicillin N synthase-like dioxygenase